MLFRICARHGKAGVGFVGKGFFWRRRVGAGSRGRSLGKETKWL